MKESENRDQLQQDEQQNHLINEDALHIPTAEENRQTHAEYEKLLETAKTDVSAQVKEFASFVLPCFTDDQFCLKEDPAITANINGVDSNSLLNKAYAEIVDDVPDYEIIGRVYQPSNNLQVVATKDKKALKQLKQSLQTFVSDADEVLTSQYYDEKDEAASAMTMGFLKANGLGSLNRMLYGHTNAYLSLRTPLAETVGALVGTVNATIDGNLTQRLNANKNEYPLISIINGAEEHLQTLSDYWKEQEDTKKDLSPERKAQYRQRLYDQSRSLLSLIDKHSESTKDPDIRKKVAESGLHSHGNEDPFHNAIESSRGTLQLYSTLEAHRDGLECDWDVSDLGILAAFNYTRKSLRNICKYSADCITLDKYNEFKDKEPVYLDGQKEYLDQLDAFYEELKQSPLKGPEDREQKIAQMMQYINAGVQKGFVDDAMKKYFEQKYQGACARSHRIAQQKEAAIYNGPALNETAVNHDNEIDLRMFDFTKKRSIFFLGRESAEHEKLRIASEELKNLASIKKQPQLDYLKVYSHEKYLEKLDEVIYRSRLYQQEKKKVPKTPAGQKRLEGAKKLEEFAKQARKALIDEINASLRVKNEDKQYTIEEYRVECAKKTAKKAADKMKEEYNFPQGAGKKAFIEAAADILIGKIASTEGLLQEGFLIKGTAALKKELLAGKEFNRMMQGYARSRKTPTQIAEELSGEIGLQQMRTIREDLQKEANAKKQKKEAVKDEITRKNAAKSAANAMK